MPCRKSFAYADPESSELRLCVKLNSARHIRSRRRFFFHSYNTRSTLAPAPSRCTLMHTAAAPAGQ